MKDARRRLLLRHTYPRASEEMARYLHQWSRTCRSSDSTHTCFTCNDSRWWHQRYLPCIGSTSEDFQRQSIWRPARSSMGTPRWTRVSGGSMWSRSQYDHKFPSATFDAKTYEGKSCKWCMFLCSQFFSRILWYLRVSQSWTKPSCLAPAWLCHYIRWLPKMHRSHYFTWCWITYWIKSSPEFYRWPRRIFHPLWSCAMLRCVSVSHQDLMINGPLLRSNLDGVIWWNGWV